MAEIEPRLREFIDVLNEQELSWLAAEILQTIRDGLPELESEEHIRAARIAVREGDQGVPREWEYRYPEVRELHESEQLKWAFEYTVARLRDALGMIGASYTQLEALMPVNGNDVTIRPITIEISFGEDLVSVPPIDYRTIDEELKQLVSAMNSWLNDFQKNE